MPSLGSMSAVVLIVIGIAGIWTPTVHTFADRGNPILPVAALAWAQAHCDPLLSLRQGTPRIQAEDLFGAAAKFDADSIQLGLAYACQTANAHATSVAAGSQNTTSATLLSGLASLR